MASLVLAGAPAHADSIQANSASVTSTGSLGQNAAPDGQVTRSQVLARAQAWVDQRVPYSSNGLNAPYSWWADSKTGGRYRQDCSGFVSMAWQLGASPNTYGLPAYSTEIDKWDLQPGDILNSSEHVVIFAGWRDKSAGTFNYYQESGRSRPTNYNTDGDLYASKLSTHYMSSYHALRYKKIVDGAGALLAASVSGDVARVGLVGSDGALYSTEANYGVGQWTPRGWARQDGAGLSNLASVTVGGVQHVYGIGGDGKVFMKDQNLDSGQWSPWYEVPGGAGGARGLTVAAVGNGAWLGIIGSDGALYTTTVDYAGGGWAGVWTRQDGAGLTSLASTVVDNVLHLYGIGGDGKVFIKDRNLESGAWSPWVEVLGGASGARGITAAVTGRAARVNIIGSDGTLYTTTADYAAGQWTGSWVQVDRSPVRSVASVAIGNVVHVYGVGMDGRIYTIDADYNIGRWLGTWAEVPGGAVA
ncbi:hypothetical protein [Streptomyces sp. NPDC004050]